VAQGRKNIMNAFAGQIILITGAARGIGAALARHLAAAGARLALVGLEPEKLAALAGGLGRDHVWFECDVTDQPSLDRAVAAAVAATGGLDVVVANAGIASVGTVAVTPVAALARVVDVNLTGVIRTVSATLPHVTARRGYYLLVASAASFAAAPGLAVYAATKSGVEQFGNALRYELAHKGIAVGTAHPCWVDTDLVKDARDDLSSFRQMLKQLPGPFGRVTSVETCAAAMARGIEKRRGRIYVPKTLAPFAALRHFLARPPFDAIIKRAAATRVPQMERETAALGRTFGKHSTEVTARDSRGQ
jgi:NAD(P)-dependent dehydrogenase (short-subunit alcohol dehydrogenase family)